MKYDTLETDGLNMPWDFETWQWWALMALIICTAPFWVAWIQGMMDWIEHKSYDLGCWWAWERKYRRKKWKDGRKSGS